jgi:putative transposase
MLLVPRDLGGRHAAHPPPVSLRPNRPGVGSTRTATVVSRKARPSTEVACQARGRRRVLLVFYLLRSGCAWRMLPREYPPWQTVYYHFWKWRRDGRLRRAHDRLREAVRESEGRKANPSAAVIDSQAVKGSGVGGPERGYDGAKRLSGRKRHLLVDTGGLVLGARVHAASLHDRDGAQVLLTDRLKEELPRLELLWADGAYTRGTREWAEQERGWRVEVPHHRDRQLWRYGLEEKPRGFLVLPRRWVVESTFAWLGHARRLAKEYERLPETGVAMINWAMSRIMLRRLTSATR